LKRAEFEHVIRAAADVVDDEIVVIGSQAILGERPDAPESLLQSAEVDVFPRHKVDAAAEIDGAIGDGSRFHETFAYYAHGVGPETVTAPAGWESRLVRVHIEATSGWKRSVTAWCLSANDLVLAKLAAGRPHDVEFVVEAIRTGIVKVAPLWDGLELMPDSHREDVRQRLDGVVSRASSR
jgi:hypothetical protein